MRVAGIVTLGSPTSNINLGFQPTWMKLSVCERNSSDSVAHKSEGIVEGMFQYCQSTFADDQGGDSFNSQAHVVQHYERIGGVISKVLSSSFTAFTATGVALNNDIPNTAYKVLLEAGN